MPSLAFCDQIISFTDMPKEDCWGEGESKRFAIDVGGAGSGAVSVLSSPEGEVKTDIQKVEDCLYYVTLTPLTVGMHRVVLLYGGREIPGGVVWFEVLSYFLQIMAEFEVSFLVNFDCLHFNIFKPKMRENVMRERCLANNALMRLPSLQFSTTTLMQRVYGILIGFS